MVSSTAHGLGRWSSVAKPHNADALEDPISHHLGDWPQVGTGGLTSQLPRTIPKILKIRKKKSLRMIRCWMRLVRLSLLLLTNRTLRRYPPGEPSSSSHPATSTTKVSGPSLPWIDVNEELEWPGGPPKYDPFDRPRSRSPRLN